MRWIVWSACFIITVAGTGFVLVGLFFSITELDTVILLVSGWWVVHCMIACCSMHVEITVQEEKSAVESLHLCICDPHNS